MSRAAGVLPPAAMTKVRGEMGIVSYAQISRTLLDRVFWGINCGCYGISALISDRCDLGNSGRRHDWLKYPSPQEPMVSA